MQKFAVRSYCRDFDTEYSIILSSCNVVPLSSRRAATAVVNLQKYRETQIGPLLQGPGFLPKLDGLGSNFQDVSTYFVHFLC